MKDEPFVGRVEAPQEEHHHALEFTRGQDIDVDLDEPDESIVEDGLLVVDHEYRGGVVPQELGQLLR